MEYRTEHDSMGEVKVPSDKYWGAQTQRSLENFKIGEQRMPRGIISALGYIKLASAIANAKLLPERMTNKKLMHLSAAALEVAEGALDGHFPLSVWQTGSGTQTNMNVNEVIANRANELSGERLLHPNDDVNMSQSSNDAFPTAMHLAAIKETKGELLPAIEELIETFRTLEIKNADVIKCGRTHLQDATPISFAQEISGWRASLERDAQMIRESLKPLYQIALGGTAVGTGLNAPAEFGEEVAKALSTITGEPFVTSDNKFHSLSSKDELVFAHGALKALAADMMKIANDVRWMASGPRLGLGEITIPANEPGSSIMPGKVNPTQCEAVTMVSAQVMANDVAVGICASQGNFELNVFMPALIYNYLCSVKLLADSIRSFNQGCAVGIEANKDKMQSNLYLSLMTATALTPSIGYENAARVVHKAHNEGISLREACTALGYLSEDEFDEKFHPEKMI